MANYCARQHAAERRQPSLIPVARPFAVGAGELAEVTALASPGSSSILRSVLRRPTQWMVVLLLIVSVGGHWAVLQGVAWATMLTRFSQTMSLAQAAGFTFDGRHPCALCKAVRQGQEAERKEPKLKPLEKLTLYLSPLSPILGAPPPAKHGFMPCAQQMPTRRLVWPEDSCSCGIFQARVPPPGGRTAPVELPRKILNRQPAPESATTVRAQGAGGTCVRCLSLPQGKTIVSNEKTNVRNYPVRRGAPRRLSARTIRAATDRKSACLARRVGDEPRSRPGRDVF